MTAAPAGRDCRAAPGLPETAKRISPKKNVTRKRGCPFWNPLLNCREKQDKIKLYLYAQKAEAHTTGGRIPEK